MNFRVRLAIFALLLAVFSSFILSQDKITIRLIVGNFSLENTRNVNQYFKPFTDQYPDVEIVFVKNPYENDFPPTRSDINIQSYINYSNTVAELADVFYINYSTLEVERALSGSILDLAPLLRDDPQTEDFFYPIILDSFRWDNAVWALPVSAQPVSLSYDSRVFDEVGLSYPDSSWQIEDFVNAVEALTLRDAEGEVVRPGFSRLTGDNAGMLLRSLSNVPFYNADLMPNPPDLNQPEIVSAMTELQKLMEKRFKYCTMWAERI